MKIGDKITDFALRHPWRMTAIMLAATIGLGLLAGGPSIWPRQLDFLPSIKVDTDPENMLREDEPTRVFHNKMKEQMDIHDMIVVGVVQPGHEDGVFTPESLAKIYELTEFAKSLRWEKETDSDQYEGVIARDIIAPSTVDNIESGGAGVLNFEWLMRRPPETREEAIAVRDKAQRIPFLNGTMVSEDGKAIAIYLPLTSKDLSYRIYSRLNEKIEELGGPEEFHITGLPVAEDTFGVLMFKQMAISAPIAMAVIFVLLLIFFKKLLLVLSPMIVAMVSVIITMSLLIVTGNTIHIMSSMIPIFIMPIAVLDAVHILSEFFDRYQHYRDRRTAMKAVMDTLFVPMLYTSLTTAIGFAALALTPIPPVQVFGLFVACGVLTAWIFTITFIPAFVTFIPESKLENFGGAGGREVEPDEGNTMMGRVLSFVGRFTYRRAKLIIGIMAVLLALALYGITLININDNPIRWFVPSHPIRQADQVLNEHFGGTYMAYLNLRPEGEEFEDVPIEIPEEVESGPREPDLEAADEPALPAGIEDTSSSAEQSSSDSESSSDEPSLPTGLGDSQKDEFAPDELDESEETPAIAAAAAEPVFLMPDTLEWLTELQDYLLLETGDRVGKSNSVADIVKTVHRELMAEVEGRSEAFRVPDSRGAVAQSLMQFQNSHRPQDLWRMVTPDYRQGSVWIQLRSGDNQDMAAVVDAVDQFVADNPPPFELEPRWFGLTYVNVIWQQRMVEGMLMAFLGSFLAVFIMMSLLYRSALWGALCMAPLTLTIALIYGLIGFVGKDYDMPVAVLSSLSLGLAVDYSIHFLTRSREIYSRTGDWGQTAGPVFGEPARAISRNAIVVGVGFLPLLLAPLRPYQTVGVFIAAILFAAGVGTLGILPALITVLQNHLFPRNRRKCMICNRISCLITGIAALALLAVNLNQLFRIGWSTLTWINIAVIIILAVSCAIFSKREKAIKETFIEE